MTAAETPLKSARREKLVEVATALFLERGFRATTMEALAEAAGLSKVTVYGYFRDKDEAFDAVARRFAEALRAAVSEALARPGPLPDVVAGALIAKHGIVHDLVRRSAFAAEILAQKTAVAQVFAALDQALIAALAERIGDLQMARILFNAAAGIAEASPDRAGMEADIRVLVTSVMGSGPR